MSDGKKLDNKVQLIAYPDSIGKDIKDLQLVLDTDLKDVIHGVHLLPFYPSSADRGFAPLTHMEVDAAFGTWKDIQKLGKDRDLIVDLVINHMSTESRYFKDFLKKGEDSEWKDVFLNVDDLLKRYDETEESLSETYRPREQSQIQEFERADGKTERLWCTFTNGQVDLDLTKESTKELVKEFILNLIKHNARVIRLDAVGYTVKKPNTTSFLLPETYDMIGWVKEATKHYDVHLLAEVHYEYTKQLQLAKSPHVDWVYDFSLPLLTLHALHCGVNESLLRWIKIRPDNQLTTLDTHDGIGVVDVRGLMSDREIDEIVHRVKRLGGDIAKRASGGQADNVDIYQLNSTYYSALGESDDAYIAARAIQFFVPGIPQVYYMGLLAGKNDVELFEKTNCGRDLNRHHYTLKEFKETLENTVVKRLFRLIKFRNSYPAFNGTFSIVSSQRHEVRLRWDLDDLYCIAKIDLQRYSVIVEYVDEKEKRSVIKTF